MIHWLQMPRKTDTGWDEGEEISLLATLLTPGTEGLKTLAQFIHCWKEKDHC